jgi:hypothetical protein
MNDLWNIVPPNPPVSLAELTGREMWKMMEENLEHTLATDPYKQMGGYVKHGGLHHDAGRAEKIREQSP